jgi:hypothetical protein
MSSRVSRFLTDRRGTTFEGIALSVSILAVAFVAAADMLDYATKANGTAPAMTASTVATPATIASKELDETPTASVDAPLSALVTRSVLDPCTGKIK